MSSHSEESAPMSVPEDAPAPSPESEQALRSPEAPFHLTAESELVDDKQNDIKTIESQDNDNTEDEHANTKRSRELKSLLALSKEARLDVNISHKRKSLDPVKLKETSLTPHKLVDENEPALKKIKIDKFPITAESEIESLPGDIGGALNVPSIEKGKKDDGAVNEELRPMKEVKMFKPNKDMYCWRCHRDGVNISCETCPRSYHQKCLKQTIADVDNWPCPECVAILKAESTQTRSPAMKGMTLEHLCSLLKFAVNRMIECNGSEPFHQPVNDKLFPEYKTYIIQPMNLKLLEKNIKENLYGSTQAFEADAKWILHNSIIFNSYQSKLTSGAKSIIKICKQEMAEIENCHHCYLNANTKKSTWFVEVCPKPHILVWAKLKGFPYWPAKAMCTNNSGMVDVRFFGAHDRAWVPLKECFLYSRRDPNSNKQKRHNIMECIREVEIYIANLKSLYGEFNYAPFKMQYDPEDELKQLLLFIPRYKPNAPPPKRRLKSLEPKVKPKKEEKDENEPEEKTKEALEGYGTDDETMENDALDTSKRNLLLQKSCDTDQITEDEDANSSDSQGEDEGESNIEPEMDDDTQLSSNFTEDKTPRGIVRTRGGSHTSPSKLKSLSRRTSEEIISKKRSSPEQLSPPTKISRRNSDQSIKSDSSRLSSVSDKISRVDISENVELTLGNTSDNYITSSTVDLETRKKPIQVEVNFSELSISPQSKTKIVDRLMQKLSSTDQDISPSKEDNKESEPKLETNIILEKYRDLVKKKNMEFSNVEASTSFGTTSVVSKELCVSSDDVQNKRSEETAESVEQKVAAPNASQELKKVDDNEMDISSTENIRNDINEVEFEQIEEPEKSPESEIAEEKNEKQLEDVLFKDISEDENITSNDETVPSETVEKDSIPLHEVSKNEDESLKKNNVSESKEVCTKDESSSDKQDEVKGTEQIKKVDKICKQDAEKLNVEKPKVYTKVQSTEKAKITPGIQVKNKIITAENTEVAKSAEVNLKVENSEKTTIEKKDDKINDFNQMGSTESRNMITYSRKDRKFAEMKRKESAVIEQPNDSNSSDDQGLILDDTQIDETNIRNIIHSSLNSATPKTSSTSTENEMKTPKRKYSNVVTEESPNKKIKINKDEKAIPKKENTFKIVPIQHILNKNIDEDSPEKSVVNTNPILLKKLSQPRRLSNMDTVDQQAMECVEIKSEPESEEDLQEFQYMEAKRKYMSALNISEKTDEIVPPKKHEIRTRSKTEEMGKGKPMDNLSKVIEEVATTFSAKHETQKKLMEKKNNAQSSAPSHSVEERRRPPNQENGEIFVKSFAKMSQQPNQQIRATPRPVQPQRPKPMASTSKATMVHTVRREVVPKPNVIEPTPQTPVVKVTATSVSNSNTTNVVSTSSGSNNKTLESLNSPGNVLILTQPGVILPTSQQLTYNAGSFVTFVPSQQNVTMMQTPQVINAMMAPSLHRSENVQSPHSNMELNRSQNFIPQNEEQQDTANRSVNPPPMISANAASTSHIQNRDIPSLIPIADNDINTVPTNSNSTAEQTSESTEDEFSLLHSMVPESVSKAISEVLCRPPPKLKPRPPGPLSQVFDSGNTSSAGPVSAKVNSISHRLGDYFRGMLIELLEDMGKVNNPEATIASLKHEIETLQQKHSAEIMDIRKNVCTILKDIQGSILEEREKLVDETRSACEIEALRRIEEAKSKQWCANCGKEAQFYCCWNTSYCDYSCQAKQWSKHMSKCTQHAGQTQTGQPTIRPQSQLSFRPSTTKGYSGQRMVAAKPTRVYLNRTTNSKPLHAYKSKTTGTLTLVDPSNLEFLTNAPGTKFIASNSFLTRVMNANSTVTSPSNGTQQTDSVNQRGKVSAQLVRPSTSNHMASVISDEEMNSD